MLSMDFKKVLVSPKYSLPLLPFKDVYEGPEKWVNASSSLQSVATSLLLLLGAKYFL